jgi:hypothetical protein
MSKNNMPNNLKLSIDDKINNYELLCNVKAYYRKFKDVLVCSNTSLNVNFSSNILPTTFYMYNDKTQLWIKQTYTDIKMHFLDYMKLKPDESYKQVVSKNTGRKRKHQECDNEQLCDLTELQRLLVSEFYDQSFYFTLNSSSDCLPVKNGVVNLKTGKLRARVKDDYFSYEIGFNYKEYHTFDTNIIDNFISDLMGNDKENIEKLKNTLGSCLYKNFKRKLIIFEGAGNNGKSMLFNRLIGVIGNIIGWASTDCISNEKTKKNNEYDFTHLENTKLAIIGQGCHIDTIDYTKLEKLLNTRSAISKQDNHIFPINCNFLMTCRKFPKFTEHTYETCTEHIRFPVTFVDEDNYDPSNKFQKLMNEDINDDLTGELCCEQLLSWLVSGAENCRM